MTERKESNNYPLTSAQKLHYYSMKYCPKKQVLNIGTSLTIQVELEWDVLKQVCNDLYPDEELSFEMMYSLIDIEASINSVNERKGILNSLESCIRKTFYSNEADATSYYREQLERKKDMGGKYNEKFFVSISDEDEEYEDVQEEVTE